jgi:hypothetical protein
MACHAQGRGGLEKAGFAPIDLNPGRSTSLARDNLPFGDAYRG